MAAGPIPPIRPTTIRPARTTTRVRHSSQAWPLRPASPSSDRSGAGAVAIGAMATSTSTSTATTTSTAITSGQAGLRPCLPIPIAGATTPPIAAAPPIATPVRVSNISASVARPRSIRGIFAAIPAARVARGWGREPVPVAVRQALGPGSVGRALAAKAHCGVVQPRGSGQVPAPAGGTGAGSTTPSAISAVGGRRLQPAGRPRRGEPAGLDAALGRGGARRGTRRPAVTLSSSVRCTLALLAAVAVAMLSLAAVAAQQTFPDGLTRPSRL